MLALVIEGLVMLGELSQAEEFYPLVGELLDTGAVALWPIFRFTHTIAGVAAGAAGQWRVAEEHFGSRCSRPKPFLNVSNRPRYAAPLPRDDANGPRHSR
jgi:hypothetical protein